MGGRTYLKTQKLVRVFDQYDVPDVLRKRIVDLVTYYHRQGLARRQIVKAVYDELRIDAAGKRYASVDWERLLEVLLEILKIVVPLILALLV